LKTVNFKSAQHYYMSPAKNKVQRFNSILFHETFTGHINRPLFRGGLRGLTPPRSLHKNFWVYLFPALLSMCSLRMLLFMSWTS